MAKISNLAFVHPEARLAEDVIVDAFAYIDRNVEIGEGCHIHPHASILSGARIGKNNEIFENAIISATPQDFRWKGEDSFVVIGENNKIREQVIINRSIEPDGKTSIGNNSFIMAQSHIGHDSSIGNYCVIGNAVKIAGNVKIGNYSILSSNALVHEKCEVGDWVLIKGGCRVNGHVPPYAVMAHNPISYFGVNAYVLKKAKKDERIIDDIAKCYRHVYQTGTSVFNALRRIKEDVDQSKERDDVIMFIEGHNLSLAALPLNDREDY
ncbi:MAG: acyl-ACP--UDP-N-acetylglucosamine O-acyltransferase [Muribaculaceae bacterium]|nr:acyl-ACP--UDP-N-acetylglucosamine O-acyltransferase [Muribaculaceae bacterium]